MKESAEWDVYLKARLGILQRLKLLPTETSGSKSAVESAAPRACCFFSETSLRLLLDKFFSSTEIIDNACTNSAGVRIGSIYGVGRGVRHSDFQER